MKQKLYIFICCLCILLSSVPAFAQSVSSGSYYAFDWQRKQINVNLMTSLGSIMLIDDSTYRSSWYTPGVITDFDLRGRTVFFIVAALSRSDLPFNSPPDNVFVWNNDNNSNRIQATYIDYYSGNYAYAESYPLIFYYYRVTVPTSWDETYNLRFTQFWADELPSVLSVTDAAVPYQYILTYDIVLLTVSNQGSESSLQAKLDEIIRQGTIGSKSAQDYIAYNTANCSDKLDTILDYLEQMLGTNESTSAPAEVVNTSQAEQLISDMQVSKPNVEGSELDADNYVDNVAMSNAQGILNIFFNQPLITTMLLIVLSLAVASFVVFGRKQ